MRHHLPLTEAEKEHIFLARLDGRTLSAIAQDLGCSIACVRKWWRIGRRHGQDGLRAPRRGRRPRGILSEFAPQVVARALTVKQEHPRWGPNRVLVELRTAITLTGLALPSRSRLATFFRAHCPACVASAQPRQPPKARLQRPTAVHEVWQFDHQEGIRLGDGQIATVSTLRDWVGGALVGSQATPVQTKHHWRKLTVAEIRGIVRAAFAEWQTLPDALQTDNELGFAGSPTDPFPSQFTLWLAGLGVTHACIRPACPTDQAQVERSHRTLANFAQDPTKLATLATFQMALDHERAQYNQAFPSRASDCAGRPPLLAHPELRQPRRPYRPEWELALFDLTRVYAYLATFTFRRLVNASGQVSLGRRLYSVGRPYAKRTVDVRFDAQTQEWVVRIPATDEPIRRPARGLDIESLTGLDPAASPPPPPVQLSFPFFVAQVSTESGHSATLT